MKIEQLDKMGDVLGREHGFSSLKSNEIVILDNAESAIQGLFGLLGEDVERDGLQDTPFRFVKALTEHTVGYREDPKLHLEKTFDVDHQDLVLVKDIPFNSLCEHLSAVRW